MAPDDDSISPAPRPVPRPGPRPGPGPGSGPGRRSAVHPAAPPPPSDPHRFGRIDDDGTVWLLSSAGERQIASWQAGDAEAAFAHFGRRFDDLNTEVTLLEERLATGRGDARKIKATAISLTEALPTASVLGDVDALAVRLAAVCEQAGAVAAESRAQREQDRAAATARKEALAAEAEELAATSTQWKTAGDRLRTILDEWKTISGLDRKVDDALWKRYSAAREAFNRRRGSHFAELDRDRADARQTKEQLCRRAEELAASTDWGATTATFRQLLAEWKAAGRAAKGVDDELWGRFKAAQDTFFTARNAASAERDATLQGNVAAKEALLVEAERIDPSNREAARTALRAILTKWDAVGNVPRERSAELERRLSAVEKKVRAGDGSDSNGPDPEAQARAQQFRDRAEQFERQAQKAQAAGRDKEAAEASASAEQWRQWAETAEQALARKR